MDKLENVLLAFSKCLERSSGCLNEPECPYVPQCFGPGRHEILPIELVEDIRTLLKAQEPRVMAYDELATFDGAFLIESSATSPLDWVFFYDIDTKIDATWLEDFDGERYVIHREDYGTYMRCWTSRPTDEQRKAVKWDG